MIISQSDPTAFGHFSWGPGNTETHRVWLESLTCRGSVALEVGEISNVWSLQQETQLQATSGHGSKQLQCMMPTRSPSTCCKGWIVVDPIHSILRQHHSVLHDATLRQVILVKWLGQDVSHGCRKARPALVPIWHKVLTRRLCKNCWFVIHRCNKTFCLVWVLPYSALRPPHMLMLLHSQSLHFVRLRGRLEIEGNKHALVSTQSQPLPRKSLLSVLGQDTATEQI